MTIVEPFSTQDLTVAYRDQVVLRQASVSVPPGHIMAILGPNGAGKSTLIKAAMGLIPPLDGGAKFFGEPLAKVRQRVGYMPQTADVDWDFPTTVRDVVTMGLYGRLGWLKRVTAQDHQKVEESLRAVGIEKLHDRQISQLSGGQKQRVFVARILAGDPDLYIMDEPFAGVDVASEQAILEILRQLRAAGKTIVMVHHDLGTVSKFADDIILLSEGNVVVQGPIKQTFTPENIGRAYGISSIFESQAGLS